MTIIEPLTIMVIAFALDGCYLASVQCMPSRCSFEPETRERNTGLLSSLSSLACHAINSWDFITAVQINTKLH